MKRWWRGDEEVMKNWWRTDEELLKTTTDYQRLPLTDWLYSIEHSNLSPDSTTTTSIYIPDSTNYKSTASGAKKPPCTEYQNPYIAKIRKCGVNWKLKNSTFLLRPEWIYPGLWVHVFKLGSIVFFLLFQGVQLLWGIGPQYPGLWVHVFKLCNFDGELALRGR